MRRDGSGDQNYGVRVVISPSSSWYGSAGGVAYIGSFDWSSDSPTYVFSNKLGNGNEKYVAEATSHEAGHTLGLYHDGATGGTTYYSGHGSWAPIMGVGYYEAITQWSKGEYAGANNTEDDLAVMLTNGASYRLDDHGDWIDNATMLAGEVLDGSGLIERTGDMDVFGFQTDAGDITINVDPADRGPNLDILVQILDDGGPAEQSFSYHRFVLDLYWLAIGILDARPAEAQALSVRVAGIGAHRHEWPGDGGRARGRRGRGAPGPAAPSRFPYR